MQDAPAIRDFGEIKSRKGMVSVRPIIEGLLCEAECFHEVKPFFERDGVCGHKVMDLKGAVDVLKRHDRGGKLAGFRVNDFQLGNALKQALRSKYELNKRWKIENENLKRVLPAEQLAAPQGEAAA